jgi:GTP 3',8-cyclase
METVDYLRLSVTNRCNLLCPYCHKEGNNDSNYEMNFSDIKIRLESAYKNGFAKLKITGGEPLMRDDIAEIVKTANEIGFKDISITTNGILLSKFAFDLKKAGLNRINIGCDSLSSLVVKNVDGIRDGLKACHDAGFDKIKINMLVLKGINDDEIWSMIDFARENKCSLQLIELINLNVDSLFFSKHHISLSDIENELAKKAKMVIKRDLQNRTVYDLNGVYVEIVGPSKEHFCKGCKKLRITSDGKLKTCIMDDLHYDFIDNDSIRKALDRKVIFDESRCK